jgi:hypothetical protein
MAGMMQGRREDLQALQRGSHGRAAVRLED